MHIKPFPKKKKKRWGLGNRYSKNGDKGEKKLKTT